MNLPNLSIISLKAHSMTITNIDLNAQEGDRIGLRARAHTHTGKRSQEEERSHHSLHYDYISNA